MVGGDHPKGGLTHDGIPSTQALTEDVAAGLPGTPMAIPTPGHTGGHCSFVVDGVLVSGDALVTGHPLLSREGPQLLPGLFNTIRTVVCAAWPPWDCWTPRCCFRGTARCGAVRSAKPPRQPQRRRAPAEGIVRDLTERGALHGQFGAYECQTAIAEVSVPATLQATIGARIDRLDPQAKRVLCAAAAIGSRFDSELLARWEIEPVIDELISAELIDQVRFTPHAEYAFHQPLIRAVACESQLKSDRTQWHRRLAVAIQQREPDCADENAALIAEHLWAADDLREAYTWQMRASAWSTNRDIAAARVSWERARQIADAVPGDDPDRTAMRIAPRTMLCVSSWRAAESDSIERFDELRTLCTAAGDKASLAIGMTGLATELLWTGRAREASLLASEQMALLESVGDPILTIGAAYVAIVIKGATGEITDVLRWSRDRHRPVRWRRHQRCKLRDGFAAGGGVGFSRLCALLVGPSGVASRPRRRIRNGPTLRSGNPRIARDGNKRSRGRKWCAAG